MNLALEKVEGVTAGGKGRVDIRGEAGEVARIAAGKLEVLLVVSGFDVDRGAEA